MLKFIEVRDGKAHFKDGEWKFRLTYVEVKRKIEELEGELALSYVSDRLKQEIREDVFQLKQAKKTWEDPDSVPQAPAVPIKARQERPAQVAASPFAQAAAAKTEGKKQDYQFAGVKEGKVDLHILDEQGRRKGEINISDPEGYRGLLETCAPGCIGDVYAAAFFAEQLRRASIRRGKPDLSDMPSFCIVFSRIEETDEGLQAVFSEYQRDGERDVLFTSGEQELCRVLQRGEAVASRIDAYRAALAALVARDGRPFPADLGQRYEFRGIAFLSNNAVRLFDVEADRVIKGDDSSVFEALLPHCHPDSVGAVRAAAATARLVEQIREEKGSLRGNARIKSILVFDGVKEGQNGSEARLAYYNGYSGGKGSPFTRGENEIRSILEKGLTPLEGQEYEAARRALEALEGKKAPVPAARAAAPQSQSQFSRSAGAVPEKATVQYLRVVTGTKGYAEGVFCLAGERPSRAEKTCLTAGQIGEKMAGLAKTHPDWAVYETALAAVKERDQEIRPAFVTVIPEYHRR